MSELPTEERSDSSNDLKTNADEDLSALLDDALQDFELQPSCSFKRSKNAHKGAKSSLKNKNSISDDTEDKVQLKDGKETGSLQDILHHVHTNHKSPNQNLYNGPNAIPNEKELEDMFNDLMKSASLEPGGHFSTSDAENVLPMMENMMQSLLSFDVLYPPLKELCNKYPEWLAENRTSLKPMEYEKYNKQFDVTLQLCQEFENHQNLKVSKTKISEDIQQKHFEKVFELMQRMQSHGNPPADIVGEFGAIPSGPNSGNMHNEEERFKSFLAQNGLDTHEKGIQFDANGMPIFPEEGSGNEEQCLIS